MGSVKIKKTFACQIDNDKFFFWHLICFIQDSSVAKRMAALQVLRVPINQIKEEDIMAVNFYLDKEQLAREIEKWIASSNLNMMLGLCRCCVNNLYNESTLVTECLKCSIQQGIRKMSDNSEWAETRDVEFLGVC